MPLLCTLARRLAFECCPSSCLIKKSREAGRRGEPVACILPKRAGMRAEGNEALSKFTFAHFAIREDWPGGL